MLRGEITPYSQPLRDYLAPLHFGVQDPQGIAIAAKAVLREAQGLAYLDTFRFATANFVLMLPLLLVRTPKKTCCRPDYCRCRVSVGPPLALQSSTFPVSHPRGRHAQ